MIHSEVRKSIVYLGDYCHKIPNQVDSLISFGDEPRNITIVGASKGTVMAMNISSINTNSINYIFLAANNYLVEHESDWNLNGKILGRHDSSDTLAGKNYYH